MALTDYSIDTSGTPLDVQRRQKLAEALMQAGSSGAPIQSYTQGLNRLAQGLLGGYESGQLDREEKQGRAQASSQFASLLNPSAPATPSATPMGAPAPSQSGNGGAFANAISGIESGGNYGELGPVTKTGDRAYGKYQVMGANIPEWTQAALGKSLTPAQFIADPQAQDATFQHRFGQYVAKYGPEGAAKAWFAGEGGMNNPDARDQLGTSVASYANQFNRNMGQPAQFAPAPQAGNASTAAAMAVLNNPYATAAQRQVAAAIVSSGMKLQQEANDPLRQLQIRKAQRDLQPVGEPYHDEDGNLVQKDASGKVSVLSAADKTPTSVREYEYGEKHPGFLQQQLMKTKAGAAQVVNNVDTGAAPAYDKVLTEGLAKAHAALSNGVEDAQARARDIAAMQGAIDAIQKNGGTTGGMGQQQILDLKKSINAGANALGMSNPFNEADISDKEFLTKFNRSMAGAQAKNAVGARVTNFELGNFLKANPGLDMSITGNQRLLGIQAQIERRNIAVGNAIRNAAASAISKQQKIDPQTVQKIITDYDEQHHITDPVTGQDLTQSYVLPEFQKQGSNPAQAQRHEQNMGKLRRYNPATGALE